MCGGLWFLFVSKHFLLLIQLIYSIITLRHIHLFCLSFAFLLQHSLPSSFRRMCDLQLQHNPHCLTHHQRKQSHRVKRCCCCFRCQFSTPQKPQTKLHLMFWVKGRYLRGNLDKHLIICMARCLFFVLFCEVFTHKMFHLPTSSCNGSFQRLLV